MAAVVRGEHCGCVVTMTTGLEDLDFTRLAQVASPDDFLRPTVERAQARVLQLKPITPEDRLRWFQLIGYQPQGLYTPTNQELADALKSKLRVIGQIPEMDERLRAYYRLQAETRGWAEQGIEGAWDGQMGLTMSRARFRLAAWGRRGGKTFHAAREAVALMMNRPYASVWSCGPNFRAVGRCFSMIKQLLHSLGAEIVVERDTDVSKLLVLGNGSKCEGVSLENVGDEGKKSGTAVGDAVDFSIVDEAAQIIPAAWTRAVLPPLMDRNGQALLIGSHEGDDAFFARRAREALEEEDWDVFNAASWEVNFYVFPQGRQTPILLAAERESPDPHEFLEQYGAIAAHRSGLVYPQFKERVHVGEFPFRRDHPVILMGDPSGGASPYGLIALQDYGEYAIAVDEFYESWTTMEALEPLVAQKPWRDNITDMVLDSAWPAEIERWNRAGYPCYPVFEKPRVDERIPLHRRALRDPLRFHTMYREMVNVVLDEMGLEPDADLDMDANHQYAILLQVEELLADEKLTPEHIDTLRGCSRLFIHRECYWTIWEHRNYVHDKKRGGRGAFRERPRDEANHLMDALGYFFWQFHRFGGVEGPTATNSLASVPRGMMVPLPPQEGSPRERPTTGPQRRYGAWLSEMRGTYTAHPEGGRNIIVPCL